MTDLHSFAFLCALLILPVPAGAADIPAEVNPFIGTGAHGHRFAGPTTPNGMVQLSSDTSIMGFSHTHLSGTGIGDYGDFLFMPYSGEAHVEAGPPEDPDAGYRSRFRHETESARPGYYRVHLDDYGIDVELTASPRAGVHRYTFLKEGPKGVVIDLSHHMQQAHNKNTATDIRIVSETRIEGYKHTSGWAKDHPMYFFAEFSEPFTARLFRDQKEVKVNPRNPVVAGINTQAVLEFDPGLDRPVVVKVGISPVDYLGAQNNMIAEVALKSFEEVRAAAEDLWRERLELITVEGGTPDQRTIFYTALYHTFIAPNIFTDADGHYRGMDRKVHSTGGRSVYTVFSMWDTFRAFHPLMCLIDPELNAAFVDTLLLKAREGGMLPKWELAGNYTGTMIGYPAVSVIYDAWVKGYRDFDAEEAFAAMKRAAMYDKSGVNFPAFQVQEKLVPKAKWFNETLGYIPADYENESVSKALEYAYYDWCIAQMARELGKTEDAAYFAERAKRYREYFDYSVGFMRGRTLEGGWKSPFNPKYSRHRRDEYTEGNAWQWTWFVPHDVNGLICLFGDPQVFTEKLNELFTIDSTIEGEHASNDISGLIGQYAHGNEPSHSTIHLFNHSTMPWRTQELVNQVLTTLYANDPAGLSGNEDCGQMSAWFILNAMGIYPICPGDPTYSLGRPLFDAVSFALPGGKSLRIVALNNGPEALYVQQASFNDRVLEEPFITHGELMEGGVLEFVMTSRKPDQP